MLYFYHIVNYSNGIAKVASFYSPGSDNIKILLDDVDCEGSETSLSQCKDADWGVHNCAYGQDAGVKCFMDDDDDVFSSVDCGKFSS